LGGISESDAFVSPSVLVVASGADDLLGAAADADADSALKLVLPLFGAVEANEKVVNLSPWSSYGLAEAPALEAAALAGGMLSDWLDRENVFNLSAWSDSLKEDSEDRFFEEGGEGVVSVTPSLAPADLDPNEKVLNCSI
jgi:hypothetical protein